MTPRQIEANTNSNFSSEKTFLNVSNWVTFLRIFVDILKIRGLRTRELIGSRSTCQNEVNLVEFEAYRGHKYLSKK